MMRKIVTAATVCVILIELTVLLVPAYATATVRISAAPTLISISSSTVARVQATNLMDAATMRFDPWVWVGKFIASVLGEQSITFTYKVKVKGQSLLPNPTFRDVTYTRVLTYYINYQTYGLIAMKIRLEDGRMVYPISSTDAANYLFSIDKSYRISGSELWNYQLPWTTRINRNIYAEVQMTWTSLRVWIINIAGGNTGTLTSNVATVTITK